MEQSNNDTAHDDAVRRMIHSMPRSLMPGDMGHGESVLL